MNSSNPALILIHGFWHGKDCWNPVVASLRAAGQLVDAIDLPGAGTVVAQRRGQIVLRDSAERSPVADITQSERTEAVLARLRSLDRPAVLVAHSMGGATASDVAERMPEAVAAVVYLSGFMLPAGVRGLDVMEHATMTTALVPSLLTADPAQIEALRIDPWSRDEDYRARLTAAFYADVPSSMIPSIVDTLHADEPLSCALHVSEVTASRYGKLPRHYIRCLQDNAIPPTCQDFMIDQVDQWLNNKTVVHNIPTSHSPFYSEPEHLTRILTGIVRSLSPT